MVKMATRFSKVYEIWAKIRGIFLPVLVLWAFVIAPNIHKPNAFQESLKSLGFYSSLAVIVFLPTILLTYLFLKKHPEFINPNSNQQKGQKITTKSYQGLMIFLVGMLILIFCLCIVAIKFIQYFKLDNVLLNF